MDFLKSLLLAGLLILISPIHSKAWLRPKSLDTRFLSYVHADPAADGNAMAEGKLSFEGRRKVSQEVESYVAAELYADQRHLTSGVTDQIHDRAARRPSVNLSEAYLNFYFAACDMRIGKQKISWGRAEGLNPTDVFGVFDYADLLNPERMGVVGLRTFFYSHQPADRTVELVFLPFYSPSRSGRINTRWRAVLEDGTTAIPVDVRFPRNTLSNTGYGIKISRDVLGWDASASYARTVDDVAGGERILGPVVRPLFLKKRTLGFDASRTVRDSLWEVHVEAAYTATPSGLDDDFLQAVAGGRRSWTDVYRAVDLDVTLECAAEHVYSRRQNPSGVLQNLIQRPFPGSFLIETKLGLTEFVSWKITGAYTFRGKDAYMVSNELSWRVTDLLDLRAGFDALSGNGVRTTNSVYEENDRWRLESTIYFR